MLANMLPRSAFFFFFVDLYSVLFGEKRTKRENRGERRGEEMPIICKGRGLKYGKMEGGRLFMTRGYNINFQRTGQIT